MEFICCYECKKRKPGCHDFCEEYEAAKGKYVKRRDGFREAKEKESESKSYINDHYSTRRR